MYQTFFIDPDEEVTSLIGRMKESSSDTLVFVVPEHSLILGSLINLKLLKREAKRLEKELLLVTQDKQGLETAKRAGIETRVSVRDLPFEQSSSEPSGSETPAPRQDMQSEQVIEAKPTSSGVAMNVQPAPQVQGQGGQSMPSAPSVASESRDVRQSAPRPMDMRNVERGPGPAASALHAPAGMAPVGPRKSMGAKQPVSIYQNLPSMHIDVPGAASTSKQTEEPLQKEDFPVQKKNTEQAIGSSSWGDILGQKTGAQEKGAPLPRSMPALAPERKMADQDPRKQMSAVRKNISEIRDDAVAAGSGGRGKKKTAQVLAGVFFLVLILAVCVGVYVFLPKAVVTITARVAQESEDVSAEVSESDGDSFPSRFIDEDREFEQEFQATGKSVNGSAKASGTVTIYNEYSEDSQPLVATTRLLTDDGKLFRTTRSVVVPGMTKDGEETKPGSIEVEVQADEPGSEFDIPPSTFTIPGFEGSPKFDAFSAKSEKAMVGGASGSEEVTVVSEEDVEKAREEVKNSVKQTLQQESSSGGNTMILADDALEVEFLEEKISPSVGTATEMFTYSVIAHVKAALFSEEALKRQAEDQLRGKLPDKNAVEWQADSIDLDYGKVTADFEQKKIDIRLVAHAAFRAKVDANAFREDVRGKNIGQMQDILNTHPELESADAELEHSYFSEKIPTLDERIEVKVQ